jgi:acyl carrier protein
MERPEREEEGVAAEIIEVIAQELEITADKITSDMTIQNNLGADSLDAINIVLALEDKYDFHIEDEALHHFKKISDIINEVKKQLEQ